MNKRKTLITMLALVCMLVVGIGFAISNIDLNINGSVTVNPTTFDVKFVTTEGQDYTVSADGLTATIGAATFTAVADGTKTVKLKLKNNSVDYDATITDFAISVTEDETTPEANPDDISVEVTESATEIEAGGEITITVTISLVKAQLETAKYDISITFDAEAVVANA